MRQNHSTGLKVYGAGQWQAEKHGRSRRTWRKLHLGVDACSGQIVAVTLTDQDVSDESQVGPLLEQIEPPIEQVTADGAYDGEPTYQTIAAHDSAIAVVIPPQENAVPSAGFQTDPSPRDTHLLMIASLGRLGWQEVTGYGKRALVETAMGRYKGLIGERLRSRGDAARRTEAVVGAAVLNRMLDAAKAQLRPPFGGAGVSRCCRRPASSAMPPCTNAAWTRTLAPRRWATWRA